MKQLTIRIADPELERRLEQLARAEGLSLNRTALKVLRKGAGLEARRAEPGIGDGLDAFFGTWSEEQAKALGEAVEIFERIDPAFWR